MNATPALLLLSVVAASAADGALDGNWVWRRVAQASADGAEAVPEAWKSLSSGNRQSADFSLARQLSEDGGALMVSPSGFEATEDIELGIVFRVPGELRGNVELLFDRIDTFAEVYVDGELLLETANAFHAHRLRLPSKAGERQLFR